MQGKKVTAENLSDGIEVQLKHSTNNNYIGLQDEAARSHFGA
jgi:hypothetical protein